MVARQGFWKIHRLNAPSDYDAAFGHGQRSRDHLFVVYGAKNSSTKARLGMAVSKKVSAKAVMRNQIKRLIRDSFQNHLSELRGLDVVVVARQACATADKGTLKASLEKHWLKVAE